MFRWQLILAWIGICLFDQSESRMKRGQYNQYKNFCIPNEMYSGLPWDCTGYLQCKKGVPDTEVFWFECAAGLYYNMKDRTCTWPQSVDRNCPKVEEIIEQYCLINPIAKIPHMDNCALYYDCSNAVSLSRTVPYMKECKYPQLFSVNTMTCEDFNRVECDARKIPVSPCDYLSYSQCTGPNCRPCTESIPGCVRSPDGKNPYPDRPLTKYFVECLNKKTTNVGTCPEGVFDPVRRICALDLDPKAIEDYCRANPNHKIPHPGNCAHYYDCTKQTSRPNYEKYEMECIYPKLFSSLQRTCLPFNQVKCGSRYEPKAPCEYVADKCFGPNCPPCEEQNPSCISLPDGKNPYFGRENTPHYIICEQERTKDITRCRNGEIFDAARRECVHGTTRPLPPIPPTTGGGIPPTTGGGIPPTTGGGGIDIGTGGTGGSWGSGTGGGSVIPPFPPVFPGGPTDGLDVECRRNPQELRVDPDNCARYFNCSQRATIQGFKPYQHECSYPKLFSATRKECMDFPSVDCGTRYEPKAPCNYENTKRMCTGAMCKLPCAERSPSCVGLPNGNNTFPGRQLTPFYMTCLQDRTLSVGVCRYGIYDFTLGHCTTDLDQFSVRSYCEKNRNTVFPHVANCARYYNCSTTDVHPVFGRYQRECKAPLLFHIDLLQCVRAEDVQCKWRFQPKDPCSYLTNQYCPTPNCPPCSDRFPSCAGLANGAISVPASEKEFVMCQGGRFVEKRSCEPNVFDPITRKCTSTQPSFCTGLTDGNYLHGSKETEYIVCENGNLVRIESCTPYIFDTNLGRCSNIYSCFGFADGNYPIPHLNTDYYECRGGKFQRKVSCAPDKYDRNTRSCAPINLCAGLTDGRHPFSDKDTDYIICLKSVVIRKDSCFPYMFDTVARSCGRIRSCSGLVDGNYEVPTSNTIYYTCTGGKFIGIKSCEPREFDINSKLCQTPSPECTGKSDGNHPVLEKDTDYYVCRNGILSNTSSCAPYKFDIYSRECKKPKNPCTGLLDGNHTNHDAHGDYQYIVCLNGLLIGTHSCFPFMYNTDNRTCSTLRSCALLQDGKYEVPYSKYDYYVCLGRNFMGIKSCGQNLYDPSTRECQNTQNTCTGLADGNFPIPGKDTDYFVCEGGKMSNNLSCAPQKFDIATRKCHTRPNLCLGLPNGKHPIEGKDSDYIICLDSVVLRTESCSPYIYEGTSQLCSTTIKSCLGLENGRYPLPYSKSDYYECLGDNFVGIKSCVPNIYDATTKLCTELTKDRCFGLSDGKHPVPGSSVDYVVCQSGLMLKSESCSPNDFDTTINDCRIVPSCVGRSNGNHSVSGSHTDYFVCENGVLSAQLSCFPNVYDVIIKKCRDSAECIGLSDGNHQAPGQNDRYIVCQNGVKIKTELCSPYVYDANLKVCATGLSCAGLSNGNNPYPGRVMNYIICKNGEMIDTYSCAPDVYDSITRRCRFQPSCRDLPNGYNPHPRNPIEFLVCSNGNLASIQSCTFGFDPDKRICRTAPTCKGQPNGNHLLPGTDNYYFICENSLLMDIASCQGTIFNDVGRVCSKIPSCFGLADGFYPIPSKRAMYIRCQYGSAKEVKSCGRQVFDPITQKCSTPSCSALQDGRHTLSGNAYDYFVCLNNNLVEIKSCSPQLYHPPTKQCKASPTCSQDGKNQMPDSNTDYFVCRGGTIIEIGTCAPRQFDRELEICTSLGPSCYGLSDGIHPHPSNTKEYVICKNGVLYKVQSCGSEDFNMIIKRCGTGPSCRDLPDGNNPDIDNRHAYIMCSYGVLNGYGSCVPDYYNPVTRLCSKALNTSDPDTFCAQNPTAIIPHPDNCAQYITCSNKNTALGNYREECQYMQLFSTYTNSCRPYREVKCGVRPEPKAPCDHEKMKICNDPAGCLPCESQNPTCVGKRDGIQAFPSKLNYYIKCQDERTIDISKCPLSSPLFDHITGKCTFVLDPVKPEPYCKANPNEVIAHPDHCGQYIDCRIKNTALGNYRHECNYPDLWDKTVLSCRNFNDVNCGTRKVPKSPCDYELNVPCMDPDNCIACNLRMPSCIGLPDGKHPFPDKPERYITCYRERTIKNEKCPSGIYDPTLRACIETFNPQDPELYCSKRPLDKVANEMNCATYFDCSKPNSIYGPYLQECVYPLLFHRADKKCRAFSVVRCGKRFEPMEPCEYLQNQQCTNLKPGEVCKPCHERLPSCIGRADGNNTFPAAVNNKYFMTCFRNRTVFVRECSNGYYDPQQRKCVKSTGPVNPVRFCRRNGIGRLPHPTNCHQYYDCTKPDSVLGPYLQECDFPFGFSETSKSCEMHFTLQCNGKYLPQNPCEYLRNQCAYRPNDLNCKPCKERLPSCVGLPDGNNTSPGQELTPMYITCMANRTIKVNQCTEGYFNPRRLRCTRRLRPGVVRDYCNKNPGVIIANPMNCAQYFDCGEESKRARTYLRECPYPMFYSKKSFVCTNFTEVDCEYRKEIIAPCDYLQNRCNRRDKTCVPCNRRMPNCEGLPDGYNSYRRRPTEYIICYRGRTIGTDKCPSRSFFDRDSRQCIRLTDISESMVRRYCRIFVDAIFPHPKNCAQYYDCRQAIDGSFLRECRYPQMFDTIGVCKNFSDVYCGDRIEPVAPCDYLQNLCPRNATNCAPCEQRLPSCRGLPNGNNPFPGRSSSEYYIKCFRDRTVSVEACQVSNYDRSLRKCSPIIDQGLLDRYCKENPNGIVPDPMNCARYYNCSEATIQEGIGYKYLRECKYPRLWNSTYLTTSQAAPACVLFTDVNCTNRYEPKAPCEYVENQCLNGSCPVTCESQYPSCRNKTDGSNIYPGKVSSEYYTVCYRERTVAIVTCTIGMYSHNDRSCVGDSARTNTAIPAGKR